MLAACQPMQQQAVKTPNTCDAIMTNLDQQDTAIKTTMADHSIRPSQKRLAANRAIGYFNGVITNAVAQCPADKAAIITAEVNERIGQLDTYVKTEQWTGPAP